MKYFYGILSILGIVLPYTQFVPWLGDNGFNVTRLLNEAMQNRISAFAWLDVIVSVVVLIGFILHEGKRAGVKHKWIPIVGTCTVGVSLGLPLFLFLREIQMDQEKTKITTNQAVTKYEQNG